MSKYVSGLSVLFLWLKENEKELKKLNKEKKRRKKEKEKKEKESREKEKKENVEKNKSHCAEEIENEKQSNQRVSENGVNNEPDINANNNIDSDLKLARQQKVLNKE